MARNILVSACLLSFIAAVAPTSFAAPGRNSAVLDLEAPFRPKIPRFVPKVPSGDDDQDRIRAAALAGRGRIQFQRKDFAGALRSYQRAYQLYPQGVSLLPEIVRLAFDQKRSAEAVRYAIISAERVPSDPILTTRLAAYLTQQQNFERAVSLYEIAERLFEEKGIEGVELYRTHAALGRLFLLLDKHEQAAGHFRRVIDALEKPDGEILTEEEKKKLLGDKPAEMYEVMAEALIESGDVEAASKMYAKMLAADPNLPLDHYHQARLAAARGKDRLALKQLEKYFKSKSTTAAAQPYELLEEILTRRHKDQKKVAAQLVKRLRRLRTDDAENVQLGYFLAKKLHDAGDIDEAAEVYRDMLKLRATSEAYAALIDIAVDARAADTLLSLLGEAVAKAGTLSAFEEQSKAIVADKKLLSELISLVNRRAKEDKLADGEALAVGLLAIEAGRYDEVDPLFDLSLKSDKRGAAALYLTWGIELFVAEQNDRSIKVFRRALKEDVSPERAATFMFYLASALEMAGRTDEAIKTIEQAIKREPTDLRYVNRRCWILYHAKRYDEAARCYRKMIEEYDDDYSSEGIRDHLRDARMALSNIAVLTGDMPAGERWLQEVLDEYPEDVGAMNDLGYLWADQGKRLLRSLQMIRVAVKAEPENAAYLDSLGWVYFRLGRFEEAVKYLEKAVAQQDEPDGVILDHLGDAYLQAGQTQKSLDAWRRAVQAFAEDEDQEKLTATRKKIKKHKK